MKSEMFPLPFHKRNMEVARSIIHRYDDISQFAIRRRFNDINQEFLVRARMNKKDPVEEKFKSIKDGNEEREN